MFTTYQEKNGVGIQGCFAGTLGVSGDIGGNGYEPNVDLTNYYNKQETDNLLKEQMTTCDNMFALKGEARTGTQGPQGEKGEKGDPGLQGEQGPPREKGDKGDPGSDATVDTSQFVSKTGFRQLLEHTLLNETEIIDINAYRYVKLVSKEPAQIACGTTKIDIKSKEITAYAVDKIMIKSDYAGILLNDFEKNITVSGDLRNENGKEYAFKTNIPDTSAYVNKT
ncbi:hypothetical protein TRFO_26343 [Tritrichomonas foetus]|uniref:Uncharacterized protein n=1 Tax=Tritrichomonas foetus TaxID=1144522 RepID=A0A1J4K4E1_9EUKA|nr:hypothetical protein TRFO_26343 [Tritrichomonas foetus]|eukprot:OHT05834.1 hypothetical protein TRFO_26343 [Tritrichomonas foetus]